ncbi:MAG: MBL fold metallo-hydrolase [Spirochaetota bacterium]
MLMIQVLIENNLSLQTLKSGGNSPPLVAEHGLSFYVTKDGRSLIFDTGKSGAFVKNAAELGVDLSQAEALVVSHGHYDHGGGLRALAEKAGFRGPLWTGPGFFDAKWSDESPKPRYLGLDVDQVFLESHGIRCKTLTAIKTGSVQEILPDMYILGNFHRTYGEETIAKRFIVERGGRRESDDFRDEIALVVDLKKGLVVIAGCAHPGLMNILNTAVEIFQKPLYAFFGGSHLVEAEEERIIKTREYLKKSGAALIALGHCTGPTAYDKLREELPVLQALFTGAQFILE